MRSGAGMIMIESTAVSENGKITHNDLCLSNYTQEKILKKLKKFLSEINKTPIGIQISHSGRKGSSFVPWIKKNTPLDKKINVGKHFPHLQLRETNIGQVTKN